MGVVQTENFGGGGPYTEFFIVMFKEVLVIQFLALHTYLHIYFLSEIWFKSIQKVHQKNNLQDDRT